MTRQARGIVLIAGLLIGLAAAASAAVAEDAGPARAELALGLGIDRGVRELQDPGREFTADCGKVFCLARIVGADSPTTVTFVWYHEGRTMARVDLPVRSHDYRTWSSKNILPAWTGAWEVKLLDPQGLVLGATSFTITADPADEHED